MIGLWLSRFVCHDLPWQMALITTDEFQCCRSSTSFPARMRQIGDGEGAGLGSSFGGGRVGQSRRYSESRGRAGVGSAAASDGRQSPVVRKGRGFRVSTLSTRDFHRFPAA